MSPQALYRKWRPQRFADVVGQHYTVQTLRNAIAQGEIAHAYLFAGPRGTGKTSVARIFAKAINCPHQEEGEPCNECPSCRAITQGSALDVLEIDGASNRGIDQIRQLREEVPFAPAQSRYKVYIIDEVHMLTNEAFNALLKTLEEPPPHVVFVFATTEPHKVLPTVLSRCQAFEFKTIPPEQIVSQLRKVVQEEGISIREEALQAIARHARGALRDALVLLDQLVSFKGGGEITADDLYEMLGLPPEEALDRFLEALRAHDGPAVLAHIEELAERGRDFELFVEELLLRSRDRLLSLLKPSAGQKDAAEESLWIRLTGELLELRRELRYALDKRILVEVFALEWIQGSPARAPAPAKAAAASASESPQRLETVPLASEAPSEARDPAPSPSTSTSTSPPPAPGALSVRGQDVQEAWKALLARARRVKAPLQALLTEASPRLAEGTLFIEYPPTYTFHKERLEQPENLRVLQDLVAETFGEVRLSVGFASTPGSGETPSAPSTPEGGSPSDEDETGPTRARSPFSQRKELAEKAERVRQAFEGEILR